MSTAPAEQDPLRPVPPVEEQINSIAAERWARLVASELEAWRRVGGAHAVAVLAVLRLHAGAGDTCHPSVDTIASMSGVGRTKVNAVIAAARAAVLVEVRPRAGCAPTTVGGRPPNEYHLIRPRGVSAASRSIPTPRGVSAAGRSEPGGVSAAEQGGFGRGEGGVSAAGRSRTGTETVREEQKEKKPLCPSRSAETDRGLFEDAHASEPEPESKPAAETPKAASERVNTARVWAYYLERHRQHYERKNGQRPPQPRLTPPLKALIQERLRFPYPVEDLEAAIRGIFSTPHNLGENDRGREFLGLEIALRINKAGNNLERFRDSALATGSPSRDGRYRNLTGYADGVDEERMESYRERDRGARSVCRSCEQFRAVRSCDELCCDCLPAARRGELAEIAEPVRQALAASATAKADRDEDLSEEEAWAYTAAPGVTLAAWLDMTREERDAAER